MVLRCWVRRSCSVSGEHDLDLEVAFDRSSQGFVPRKESGSEAFGQGDVGGVVSGEVGPELEDASEQALVPRSSDGQVEVVTQSLCRSFLREVASEKEAAEG